MTPEEKKAARELKLRQKAEKALAAQMALGAQMAEGLPLPPAQPKPLTKCPVGFWCRANSKADKFFLGRYEEGAKKPTGLPIGEYPTRELLLKAAQEFAAADKAKAKATA